MNAFKIGDKVIYPNQGLGVIEDIQDENYYGEDFRIYHLRILHNDTLVMVPSSNADEIGIRKPASRATVNKLFHFIRNGEVDVTLNWKGRYKENAELMQNGSILDVALVLKSLFYLNLIKPLSFREKRMMEKAKELVVSEVSEVASASINDIEKKVIKNLSFSFKDVPVRVDS